MNKSESIKELGLALSKAQGELKPLIKNSANSFFKSHYADLNESVEKILPILSKHGLSVAQGGAEIRDNNWVVQTILIHSSGEWLSFDWPVLLTKDKNGPQDFASSASYARRHAIQSIVSAAASDDDDANKAQDVKPVAAPRPVKNYAPGAEDDIGFKSVEDSKSLGDLGDTKITFGKWTGKTIKEVGLSECQKYVVWLKDSSVKQGKDMSDSVKAFCDIVDGLSK